MHRNRSNNNDDGGRGRKNFDREEAVRIFFRVMFLSILYFAFFYYWEYY